MRSQIGCRPACSFWVVLERMGIILMHAFSTAVLCSITTCRCISPGTLQNCKSLPKPLQATARLHTHCAACVMVRCRGPATTDMPCPQHAGKKELQHVQP